LPAIAWLSDLYYKKLLKVILFMDSMYDKLTNHLLNRNHILKKNTNF
jgi:hypothetical protein